ncbi:RA-domain-containing protein [Tothia fuscella]|uniref:RA-domain-containing protein n=1 Tax=Tothia fuscella TaxID=1048955 RepID=A0A9P4NX94_9PEZI|nr:RA-domain-containing protein [Tothia fuscella]
MSAYKPTTNYHEDSDADDEYERSVFISPQMQHPDFQSASPSDSDSPSTEHTPTTYSHREGISPRGLITEWSAEQCADFVSGLGLPQYGDSFVDEAITGDALVALLHSDLKEMGINSIGHRLTILKGVYDMKLKQNVTMEPEHYIPLSAESESKDTAPTQDDIARIIHIIKDRDAEMRLLRDDLQRISEENRKLREEVLPLVKQAKDLNQPLPTPSDYPAPSPADSQSKLQRKFSTKRLFLSNPPKGSLSPTTIQEGRGLQDGSTLDPSAAAMAASSHLTASMRDMPGGNSPNLPQPSPTSPAYSQIQAPSSGGSSSRAFRNNNNNNEDNRMENGRYESTYSTSSTIRHTDKNNSSSNENAPLSGNSLQTPASATSSNSTSTRETNPQVEIFKSFRVSIDDPCHKVLPVALKKYNITADWRQYALYIVHGDQERCLGLNERPLILFKQLDREGRKPMFMLRKHASPMEGSVSTIGAGGQLGEAVSVGGGGGGGGNGGMSMGGSRGVQLPGGVL